MHLIQIGNSKGIRIPKPLIQQANLEGREIELKVVEGGLLIAPVRKAREGWEDAAKAHATKDDEPLMDFPNEFDEEEWTW